MKTCIKPLGIVGLLLMVMCVGSSFATIKLEAKPEVKVKTIVVKTVEELMATESQTKEGNVTVLIEEGTYVMPKGLWLTGKNVTYKGKTGKRDKVILTGQFKTSHIFWITNDQTTIQDLSVGEVNNHAIQIHSEKDADGARIKNVRFFDTKEQMLKASGAKDKNYSDYCTVEDCLFEFTKGEAFQYYTGGIDVHKGNYWTVRNNTFKGIQMKKGNLTEGAIHFWDDSSGTLIENNIIKQCDRGIMLGLDNSFHSDGTISGNVIETTRDVGIYLCNATRTVVRDNKVTVLSTYPNAIEYRFKTDGSVIEKNTVNRKIVSRNGGKATVKNNTTVK